MDNVVSFLILTATIGITGALQPGPLQTLIISQTMKHGVKEGIKVSFAPLITDIPIIIVVLFVLSKIAQSNIVIGIISLLGFGYLAYLSYISIKLKEVKSSSENVKPQSLKKGVITNFLNPAVYLFWSTLGAAMISKAIQIAPIMPLVYLVLSYSVFICGNVLIAYLVGKFRNLLQSKMYIWIIKVTGLLLGLFSISFLIRGLNLLGFSF